ncbi:MAG TPA: aminoacyl-tRNA hydrolase [Bacteroidia bacterium]|nr:aminoacyl-tRNA hydrolase [Sphingobacteriales bacterium]HPD66386.1 aminoacyl-tRNA hydrolase [Bacteroidia bacterium]HRS60000.1 aminoacyl-tRNA hydrolase [Bacteroidia bacterium]HRU69116.1 aminoacyl-tRNA hydrolase [Bacteroidia bacterium]
MKLLVAGLGNIGDTYQNTRHNAGFLVVDFFRDQYNLSFSSGRYADFTSFRIKNKEIIFIKPVTYMNNSGKAVRYWLGKLELTVENLLVIVDDVALPTGKIRLKTKGGDGGHNGLNSIIDYLGTTDFARLRFGIGNNYFPGQQVDYVLGEWTPEEKKIIGEKIPLAHEAVICWALEGAEMAMTKYNRN